jgi:hypothetical protein
MLFRKPLQNFSKAFPLYHWPIFVISAVFNKFSPVYVPSLASGEFLGTQSASCKHFQGKIAAVGSQKMVTEWIFPISGSYEQAKTFFYFSIRSLKKS